MNARERHGVKKEEAKLYYFNSRQNNFFFFSNETKKIRFSTIIAWVFLFFFVFW